MFDMVLFDREHEVVARVPGSRETGGTKISPTPTSPFTHALVIDVDDQCASYFAS